MANKLKDGDLTSDLISFAASMQVMVIARGLHPTVSLILASHVCVILAAKFCRLNAPDNGGERWSAMLEYLGTIGDQAAAVCEITNDNGMLVNVFDAIDKAICQVPVLHSSLTPEEIMARLESVTREEQAIFERIRFYNVACYEPGYNWTQAPTLAVDPPGMRGGSIPTPVVPEPVATVVKTTTGDVIVAPSNMTKH